MILFLTISLNEDVIDDVVKINPTDRRVQNIVKKLMNDVKKNLLKLNLNNLDIINIYLCN